MGRDDLGVAYNFVPVDREQLMLLPVSMADWLPEDHLVWFVIDTVDGFDLSAFRAAYRLDGRGGAAFEPAMMLSLLIYAYCVGERSSRRIERRLVEDVAFRVVAGNQRPDHATIARFRVTHEKAIAGLFAQVLRVCARAGVLRPGLVAIDGTKMLANASAEANMTAEQIAAALLAEACELDAAEDAAEAAGPDGGCDGGVRADLRSRAGRRARLKSMLEELQAEAQAKSYETAMAERAAKQASSGRRLSGQDPRPDASTRKSRTRANATDPDSRLVKAGRRFVQGYNAQAVATPEQYVLAAQAGNGSDRAAFAPMINDAKQNLRVAGHRGRIRRVVADAGYWNTDNVTLRGVETFIAPGKARKLDDVCDGDRERSAVLARIEAGELDTAQAAAELAVTVGWVKTLLRRRRRGRPDTLTNAMVAKLETPRGKRTYNKRAGIIEPVFAQTKHNRKIVGFSRRGLNAVDSEWKLICATHNLLKLYRTA